MEINPFLQLKSDRSKQLAGVDVEMAEQAVQDADLSSRRAANALATSGGRGPAGGGAFSRLRGRRGGVSLGGLMTGGLAAANRAKLAETKKDAIKKGYAADFEAAARSQYGFLGGKDYKQALGSGYGSGSLQYRLTDAGDLRQGRGLSGHTKPVIAPRPA